METQESKVLGFGFTPGEGEPHFLVTIPPKSEDDSVYISEHFEWDESDERRELHFALGKNDAKMRVVLPRLKWDEIAEATKAEFNRRLREEGGPTGQWQTGQVPVARLCGKELVLLGLGH
jgi:hypothetical protein